jgi:RecB family exonuclease
MTDPNQILRLSVSKCKTFDDCKKKYQFNYILKLPKKTWAYHTLGKICHSVLEYLHLAYLNGSKEPPNVIMSEGFKLAKKEYAANLTPEITKEAFELLKGYLEKITTNNKLKISNVVAVEKKFELALNDKIILNGAIDRIQIDNDGVPHVSDYKTTKNKKYLQNDWFQLLTYCYVMWLENPTFEKIRASYILLRHGYEYISTEFSIEQIMAIKDKYIAYAESICNEKDFPANPSMLCNYCDFLEHCEPGLSRVKPSSIHGEVSW